MKRVLLVGLDPATVDFSDPALTPGMSAEKIHAGIKVALADMAERGWQNCFINPDETAAPAVERRLAEARYDCVVIGAGVRLPPSRLVLFCAGPAVSSSPGCRSRNARAGHEDQGRTITAVRQRPGWKSRRHRLPRASWS